MHGDPGEIIATELALAGVDPGAHREAEAPRFLANGLRASDCSGRTVECRKEPVSRRLDLIAAEPFQLLAHGGVVLVEQLLPLTVAYLGRSLGRADNVGEQHRLEDAVDIGLGPMPRQELLHHAE